MSLHSIRAYITTAMPVLNIKGAEYDVDDEGYLNDRNAWSEEYAVFSASIDGLELTSEHWQFIAMLQEYYEEYQFVPNIRGLSKVVAKRLGVEKSDTKYLHALFPGSPAKQLARYAGLPKPTGCV